MCKFGFPSSDVKKLGSPGNGNLKLRQPVGCGVSNRQSLSIQRSGGQFLKNHIFLSKIVIGCFGRRKSLNNSPKVEIFNIVVLKMGFETFPTNSL